MMCTVCVGPLAALAPWVALLHICPVKSEISDGVNSPLMDGWVFEGTSQLVFPLSPTLASCGPCKYLGDPGPSFHLRSRKFRGLREILPAAAAAARVCQVAGTLLEVSVTNGGTSNRAVSFRV